MNRRSFLRTLGVGVVATAALAHIPASVIKSSEWLVQSGRHWAQKMLLKVYQAYTKANGREPYGMIVGSHLFYLYESELQVCERLVDIGGAECGLKFLAFKCARVSYSSDAPGYGCLAISKTEFDIRVKEMLDGWA